MAKRAKEYIEVIETFRSWPYGESTEPYRYVMEKPKPVRAKRVKKVDPYSALMSSKPRRKSSDKHSG